jgi:hypothetical protein
MDAGCGSSTRGHWDGPVTCNKAHGIVAREVGDGFHVMGSVWNNASPCLGHAAVCSGCALTILIGFLGSASARQTFSQKCGSVASRSCSCGGISRVQWPQYSVQTARLARLCWGVQHTCTFQTIRASIALNANKNANKTRTSVFLSRGIGVSDGVEGGESVFLKELFPNQHPILVRRYKPGPCFLICQSNPLLPFLTMAARFLAAAVISAGNRHKGMTYAEQPRLS